MSSESPKTPSQKDEILLIGDNWIVGVFADAFAQKGVTPKIISLQAPTVSSPTGIAAFVGNGDPKSRVTAVMGEDLADKIWNVSESSYDLAKDFCNRHSVEIYEKGLVRVDNDKISGREKAFSFNPEKIKNLFAADYYGEIETIQKLSTFNVRAKLRNNDELLVAPVMVFLTDLLSSQQFHFLWDKIVPMTLSSFKFTATKNTPEYALTLFNAGADFGIRLGEEFHAGSFRNLFEDRAVGAQKVADAVTQSNVTKFFAKRGWIDPTESPYVQLSIESISCDGLPLVGTLPDMPGVHVVSAFSGRSANFVFDIAPKVASAILSNGTAHGLEAFSLKRFT